MSVRLKLTWNCYKVVHNILYSELKSIQKECELLQLMPVHTHFYMIYVSYLCLMDINLSSISYHKY